MPPALYHDQFWGGELLPRRPEEENSEHTAQVATRPDKKDLIEGSEPKRKAIMVIFSGHSTV